MNAASTFFQTTGDILAALKAIISALQLPDTFDPAGPAFGNVELFDSNNLGEAFSHILLTQQRVCLIVPLGERFEKISSGQKLIMRRQRTIVLLISDQVIGNRNTALWGDAKTPGAMGLMELALPAVTGQLIANPNGVVLAPAHTMILSAGDTEKKLPNRMTVSLELECIGGRLEAATNVVP